MSVGSVLVEIAIILVVGAYLARPFRALKVSADVGRVIESWVADARAEDIAPSLAEKESEPLNFCRQCGRRVVPGDRFCAGCGTRLSGGRE
jgi:hypothetical protein